jgi:cell division septation protein DedD
MKKNGIMALALSAVLLLTGASVWEGAAAVASNGELPEGGYYAASNSFPRNTVVDVINLETGKSIRLIIASGLDSPGLLAILSREAAGAIGLQNRSIGRVRMTQPADPVAFSRFTEGRSSSGDPDFDPRAAVETHALREELLPAAETAAETTGEGILEASPGTVPEIAEGPEPIGDMAGESGEGSLPAYPEWPFEDTLVEDPRTPEPVYPVPNEYLPDERIVDIPEAYEPPVVASRDDSIIPEPAPVWIDSGEAVEAPDLADLPDPAKQEPDESVSGLTEPEDLLPETSFPGETLAESREEPLLMPWENYDLTLVPAEERPPEVPAAGLPPEAEIPPIPTGPVAEPPVREPYMDIDSFIGPIEGQGVSEAVPPPIEPAALESAALESAKYPGTVFSVPVIDRLERGKYYLQLAAFSRAESVEQELSKIDKVYPLAIQADGSPDRPLYRVLVGPVNLGESGALLQRFKGTGWGDAFIRNGS